MLRRLRQALILLAALLFTGQVLAGPLFVCADMRTGPLMSAPDKADPHDHRAADAHQMTGQALSEPQHPESAHLSADGAHHCQHLCGLCLASTPFLSFSQQSDFAVRPSRLLLPPAVPLLDRQPDTPFRPPIFA